VFTRDAIGIWSQQTYVKASNTDVTALFGFSVALSGDTLAIGADQEGSVATGISGDQSDTSAPMWTQQAYLKASNTDAGDFFGHSLALNGDTLVVGASAEDSVGGDQTDNSVSASGAAYIFTRDASRVWSQQAYIKASNPDQFDEFGTSVAVDGDTVAVAAGSEDSGATGVEGDQADNSADDSGAVYVSQ